MSFFSDCKTAFLWSSLLLLLVLAVSSTDGPKEYRVNINLSEFLIPGDGSNVTLSPGIEGMLTYSANFDTVDESGHDAVRIDIEARGKSFTELNVYGKHLLQFSWCESSQACRYADLFTQPPLPRFWCADTGGSTPSADITEINGVHRSNLTVFSSSHDGKPYVTLYCNLVSLLPVRVSYWITSDTLRQLDFDSETFETEINEDFLPPTFCPVIPDHCLYLDMVVLIDTSHSLNAAIFDLEKQFLENLVEKLPIGKYRTRLGLIQFGTIAEVVTPPLSDATDLTSIIEGLTFPSLQFTALISAVYLSWEMIEDYARLSASKAVLVITDGNGNRPCCNFTQAPLGPESQQCCGTCFLGSSLPCQNLDCCQIRHDDQMVHLYASYSHDTHPEMFVVGVTDNPSNETLETLSGGHYANIMRVQDFADLVASTDSVAQRFICEFENDPVCFFTSCGFRPVFTGSSKIEMNCEEETQTWLLMGPFTLSEGDRLALMDQGVKIRIIGDYIIEEGSVTEVTITDIDLVRPMWNVSDGCLNLRGGDLVIDVSYFHFDSATNLEVSLFEYQCLTANQTGFSSVTIETDQNLEEECFDLEGEPRVGDNRMFVIIAGKERQDEDRCREDTPEDENSDLPTWLWVVLPIVVVFIVALGALAAGALIFWRVHARKTKLRKELSPTTFM